MPAQENDNTARSNGIQQAMNGAQSFNFQPAPVQLSSYDISQPSPAPSSPPPPSITPPSHPHMQRRHSDTFRGPSKVTPLDDRETQSDLASYNRGKHAMAPSQGPLLGLQRFHSMHATASVQHPHALPQYSDTQAPRQLPSGALMQESEQETEQDVVGRHGEDSVKGKISAKKEIQRQIRQTALRPYAGNPHPVYAKDLRGSAVSLREDVSIMHFLDKLHLYEARSEQQQRS